MQHFDSQALANLFIRSRENVAICESIRFALIADQKVLLKRCPIDDRRPFDRLGALFEQQIKSSLIKPSPVLPLRSAHTLQTN